MTGALVSVLVCTYNREASLVRCLESLLALRLPTGLSREVVVVDDGSTDATAERVAALAGDHPGCLRLVPGPGTGVAAARNQALAEARGEWVAFCDDDQVADPGWLAELLRVASSRQARLVAGSRRLVAPEEALRELDPRLRTFLGEEEWGGVERPLSDLELPNTGNLLARRELLLEAGGFAVEMVEGGEDTELLYRLAAGGEAAWSAPAARMAHHVEGNRCTPAYLLWRARRSGAAEARIRLRGSGPSALAAGLLRWLFIASIKLPIRWVARLAGRPGAALYHRYVLVHALAYIRFALGARRPGPAFRAQGYRGGAE